MSQVKLFDLESFNVLIAGNGDISRALVERLLGTAGLNQIVILGRKERRFSDDSRVVYLHVDAEKPESAFEAAASVHQLVSRIHLLINTVGVLHTPQWKPEKNLKTLDVGHTKTAFLVNSIFLAVLTQAFSGLLRHDETSVLASLSARVGSIEDNQLGGWYSYRASKAAHNMFLRTIAQEWRISHRKSAVVAIHPGTVRTRLSRPFLDGNYRNHVLTPDESARAILNITGEITPRDSGCFLDWQGKSVPW